MATTLETRRSIAFDQENITLLEIKLSIAEARLALFQAQMAARQKAKRKEKDSRQKIIVAASLSKKDDKKTPVTKMILTTSVTETALTTPVAKTTLPSPVTETVLPVAIVSATSVRKLFGLYDWGHKRSYDWDSDDRQPGYKD